MQLTSSQQKAIAHNEGPCLVLAVPGAGKTTVLIERLQRLLLSGIDPMRIASITFSKQQALDMKARFESRFGPHPGLTFSTIHAFCYRILRHYAAQNRTPLHLLEGSSAYNKYLLISKFYEQINRRPISDEERDDFFRIDSYLKNACVDYETYVKRFLERFPNFEKIAVAYEQFKVERNLIDFDDMLVRTLQVLQKDDGLRRTVQNRFYYWQVDEAQDTSPLQLQIIRILAEPENNLFLVADDDQAIYGFRGANPSDLLHFQSIYPSAKIYMMQENHRSSQNIVRLSAHFIQGNRARFEKTAVTDDPKGPRIEILLTKSLRGQLRRITKALPAALASGTCAVLFRNNLSAVACMDALDRAEIPFVSRANPELFFRHPILRDVFDFLDVARDPGDLSTFSRIYYKCNAYLKKDFIRQMQEMDPHASIFDRLRDCRGAESRFYQNKIDELEYEFSALRKGSVTKALERLENSVGYGEYLKEKARKEHTAVNAHRRILETLHIIAEGMQTGADLYAHLRRLRDLQKSVAQIPEETTARRVILSTIHGAKGLEYDTVWLIDLIQGEFPSTAALERNASGSSVLLEEERRLFYVAMTRAKTQLHLIGRKTVHHIPCEASQFLRELTKRRVAKKG